MILGLNGFCQTDSLLNLIEPKGFDKIENQPLLFNDSIYVALQGKLIDPIICNELGFKLITGTEVPNFGLNIDYNPLFLKKFIGQIGYRSNLKNSHILNVSIESRYLIDKYQKHFDFKLKYDRFSVYNSQLKDFNKLSFGPIYRGTWTSIGCFVGQDSYERQIGVDFFVKYCFHHILNTDSYNENETKFVFQSLIGLWDKEVTYDLNLDYLICLNYSCGLGYKKLYDFNEIYFTFRYLFRY